MDATIQGRWVFYLLQYLLDARIDQILVGRVAVVDATSVRIAMCVS